MAPQRVQDAAEQMRNTAPQGSFRGYVPQPTGAQRPVNHAVPQQQGRQPAFTGGAQNVSPKKKSHTGLILLITVLALAAIGGAIYAGVQISRDTAEKKRISDKVTPYDNLYCPGVYVDGIHLGGMTPEQAKNSVMSQINQRTDAWKVQLVYEGSVVADINTAMLNMNVNENDINILLNQAWTCGHTGTQAERYAQMEELEQTPYTAYSAKPSGDTSLIDSLLAQLKSKIDQPAQDATAQAFDPSRSYPFVLSEEVYGRNLNIQPIREQLYQMVSTMTSGTVELKPDVIEPKVLLADLQTQYALRATASTPIDRHSTDNRNNNIRRCFEKINGYILEPGRTFSFNKTVGDRTLANGFYTATEYINDEHVIGVGGGACQASTTLYQAAVCAGLQIVSRRPHSDSVSYTAYGTDATVYMGGKQIDLTFKNDTGMPIYIVAAVVTDPSNKKRLIAKVSIYGQSLGNVQYTLETETVEILPSIMEPVYVSDKENAGKAKDGCIVNSYRVTYTDGVMTDRKKLYTDTYSPKPEKIYDPSMVKN